MFASNVSYEPKPDVDDRLFLGEVPVEININNSNFALKKVPMHFENSIITGIKIA